jgi:hypothetical protein
MVRGFFCSLSTMLTIGVVAKAHLVEPLYDYARRSQWMLMGALRQQLTEFFLALDLDLPLYVLFICALRVIRLLLFTS